MTKIQNWTSAAALFISEDTCENWCFWRNPFSTTDNSGRKRCNPSHPKHTYSHYISCRWEATSYMEKKMKFGMARYFLELLFPSEMKLQNCPIIVLFTSQIHYGSTVDQPTPVPLRIDLWDRGTGAVLKAGPCNISCCIAKTYCLVECLPAYHLAYTFPSGVRKAL